MGGVLNFGLKCLWLVAVIKFLKAADSGIPTDLDGDPLIIAVRIQK